jgi:hypothetical protein
MAERHRKRAYIIGMTPDDAAALADTYKRNNVAADPKLSQVMIKRWCAGWRVGGEHGLSPRCQQ